MNPEREAWRPQFLREPVDQRGWPITTRGLRSYLIKVAEDDGTLLKRCSDPFELAASLGVHAEEAELVRGAIEKLLGDGFLRWEGDGGWLGVDRLVTFTSPVNDGGSAGAPEAEDGPVDPDEPPAERRRRLARERKQRSRGRSGQRDRGSVTSVTSSVTDSVTGGVTESVTERDQRDLPPHTPPSDIQDKTEQKRAMGARVRRDIERDRGSVTSVTEERDTQRDRGQRAVERTFSLRELGQEPPQAYLDVALMSGVKPEQAASTWKHYHAAGLPEHGLERPFEWLTQQAIEYRKRTARIEPKGAPRAAEDTGTRGHERLEPQGDHRRIAEAHGLKLEEFVDQVRKHPRAQKMSTVQQWELLTKLLEAAAARQQKRGAA